MKAVKFFAFAFMALVITSCDSKQDGFRPEQTKISGPLGEFFEVIDRNYGIRDGQVMVEIKRIKEGLPAPWEEGIEVGWGEGRCTPLFNIEVKDVNGDVVKKDECNIVYQEKAMRSVIDLSVDESSSIPFNVGEEDCKTFKIGSSFKVNPKETISNDVELSADNETEETKPSLEVILPSTLKGKVEVAFCGEVTKSNYGFPEVEIGFKLLQTVNTSSLVSSYGQMWIVGVGQDEKGRDVKELLPNYGEWRTGDSNGKEFKEFLESEPGETINMTFTGGNDGDVSEGINKVAKFKLKITN